VKHPSGSRGFRPATDGAVGPGAGGVPVSRQMTEVAAGVEVPQPGMNRSSKINRTRAVTTTAISRCPSRTTRPTTAVANTVAAVVTPRNTR
jgi:hypothetical protein